LLVALLDAVPRISDLVVAEAPFAFDAVVDVLPLGPRVDEVTAPARRSSLADEAVLVLGPLEAEDVARDVAVHLAPGRPIGALPPALNRRTRVDEVQVPVQLVVIDAVPARAGGQLTRLDLRDLGRRGRAAA